MIIILYGLDEFRKKEKLEEIKNKFREKTKGEIFRFGEDIDFEKFKEKIFSKNIFTKRKMIILENFSKNKIFKKIWSYLEKIENDKNLVIIFLEKEIPKELEKRKYVYKFDLLTNEKLKSWIKKKILEEKGEISKEAVDSLVSCIGNDLFRMNNEIDKLLAYCQKKTITTKDIELLLEAKTEENIFQLIDVIANKDRKKALRLLEGQFKKGISSSYLLSLLLRQFRLLFQIKERKFFGPSFLVYKLSSQARKYELEEIKKIYQNLLMIDLKTKTSQIKPEVFFDLFIAGI